MTSEAPFVNLCRRAQADDRITWKLSDDDLEEILCVWNRKNCH